MDRASCRVKDLEVRTTNSKFLIRDTNEEDDTAEMVQWYYNKAERKEICYTIAYWKKDEDDYYEMICVLDRPFRKNVDGKIFYNLALYMQKYLNKRKFNNEV